MNKQGLEGYRDRFQSLHCDQHEGRPRPHKAVMLLAVLSLADNGQLLTNEIHYSPELIELFKRFFGIVRQDTDQCTPWNPFFHLKGDGFWHLKNLPGQDAVLAALRQVKSGAELSRTVDCASLDEELFEFVAQPAQREVLRQAIIDRYFSAYRQELLAVCREERDIGRVREDWRNHEYKVDRGEVAGATDGARSAAFARTVRQAYDFRCAACGIRFLYDDITVIDAAHLIPFRETRDDSPQNGMALCKNHHWLMDSRLIAPGPGRRRDYAHPRWQVRKGLDDRIEGQRELLELENRAVILPSDERLRPKPEALDRRMEILKEAC